MKVKDEETKEEMGKIYDNMKHDDNSIAGNDALIEELKRQIIDLEEENGRIKENSFYRLK